MNAEVLAAARGALGVLGTMRQQWASKDPRMSYAELQFDDADVEDITITINALLAEAAENAQLRAALEKHGRHIGGCLYESIDGTTRQRGVCTCGLSATLAAVKEAS